MTGMIETHTKELVQCIVEVRELMDIKSMRMGDYSLAVNQRVQAGKDFLTLIDEYMDYVSELEEITETYIGRDYRELQDILDPYLDMRVKLLLRGIQ